MDDTSLVEAQTWLRRHLRLQPDDLLGDFTEESDIGGHRRWKGRRIDVVHQGQQN
jgi:hypothetical protein